MIGLPLVKVMTEFNIRDLVSKMASHMVGNLVYDTSSFTFFTLSSIAPFMLSFLYLIGLLHFNLSIYGYVQPGS